MKEIVNINLLSAACLLIFSCSDGKKASISSDQKLERSGLLEFFTSDTALADTMDPKQYKRWHESDESHLRQKREMGDFEFTAFYQTNNYLALKEMDKKDTIEKKEFDNKLSEYGSMTYVSYRIENMKQGNDLMKANLSSDNEYYARLEYFSFKMQNDFKLVNGRDTLDCLLYHFERTYSLTPYTTFVLGFPKIEANKGFKIIYHDKVFNNGIIVTNFDKNIINNIPKLAI